MRIIGRTVQVTQGPLDRKRPDGSTEAIAKGEDKGHTGVALAWIKQVGMPDARTPANRRWLLSVRKTEGGEVVNYYPHELALEDGGAVPLQPDADETPEG